MKKVRIIGLLSEQQAVLKQLQLFGRVQFTGETEGGAPNDAEAEKRREDVAFCLEFLDRYRVKTRNLLASLDIVPREISEQNADELEDDIGRLDAAIAQVRGYEQSLGEVSRGRERINTKIRILSPWESMDIKLNELSGTKHTHIAAGCVLQRDYNAFTAEIGETPLLAAAEISTSADSVYFLVAVHNSASDVWDELCKKHNFTATDFSDFSDTPRAELEKLNAELSSLDAAAEQVATQAGSGDLLQYFEDMSDLTAVAAARAEVCALSGSTEKCFVMNGWVPTDNVAQLDAALAAVTESLVVEYSEVAEGDDPPVLVRNSSAVKPFESITDAFSHPAYDDVDPNGMVAVFYSIFFGLMLGDAGYGILLTLACAAVLLFLHPKPGMRSLLGVFLAGGISATAVGVIFGSYFGASLLPALLPVTSASGMPLQLEIPMEMIILSIGLGVLHLFAGYIAMAVKNIRHGHVFAAIFDQGFWILLITGLLMLAAPLALPGETGALLGNIGKWTAIVSALVLVATQGRDKKGIFGKLAGGLGALYNVSGFLGDALSYTRLFALGLSSGIIAWVFNLMSTLLGTDSVVGIIFMVIVLLIGHSINIALSLLSAYVHTNRLQYVEFFGKFMDGNGLEYRPLARRTSYISIVSDSRR